MIIKKDLDFALIIIYKEKNKRFDKEGGIEMRRKEKNRKDKQILIRVNNEEKQMAETLSKKEGMNTSEFFRSLLWKYEEQKKLDIHLAIVEKYEQMLEKYRKLLDEYKK